MEGHLAEDTQISQNVEYPVSHGEPSGTENLSVSVKQEAYLGGKKPIYPVAAVNVMLYGVPFDKVVELESTCTNDHDCTNCEYNTFFHVRTCLPSLGTSLHQEIDSRRSYLLAVDHLSRGGIPVHILRGLTSTAPRMRVLSPRPAPVQKHPLLRP